MSVGCIYRQARLSVHSARLYLRRSLGVFAIASLVRTGITSFEGLFDGKVRDILSDRLHKRVLSIHPYLLKG